MDTVPLAHRSCPAGPRGCKGIGTTEVEVLWRARGLMGTCHYERNTHSAERSGSLVLCPVSCVRSLCIWCVSLCGCPC